MSSTARRQKQARGRAPRPSQGDVRSAAAPAAEDARWLAWVALLAAVVLVPLANSVFTMPFIQQTVIYDMYDLPKVFVLRCAVLVSLGALAWHVSRVRKVRLTPLFVPVLVLLGWIGLTAVLSISPATSVFGQYQRSEGLLTYVLYALVFFLVVQLADDASRIRRLAEALFWVSIPVSIYGIVQAFGIDPVAWGYLDFAGRAFSTYGNPEGLGNFLTFAVPVATALALSEKDDRRRAVWWIGALVDLACLMLTFTRGAWIGTAVALVLLAVLVWRQGATLNKRVDGAVATAGAVGLAALALVTTRGGSEVTSIPARLASLLQPTSGSGLTRLAVWRSAVEAVAARPVFGFGADTFRLLFPAFRTSDYFRFAGYATFADNAHDYPLQLAATIGVPGALLLFGIIAWGVFLARRSLVARAKSTVPGRVLAAGFAAALVGYLVCLGVGISEPGTTFLLWVALGVVVSPVATSAEWAPRAWLRPAAACAAGACALLIGLGLVPVMADRAFLEARLLTSGPPTIAAIETAVRLAPYNDAYRAFRGTAYAEDARDAVLAASQGGTPVSRDVRKRYDEALARLEDATARSPWYHEDYQALAVADNFAGEFIDPAYYRRALRAADDGLSRFPNTPDLHLERARALLGAGDTAEAERSLRAALALEPRAGGAAALLAQVLAQRGDEAGALKLLKASEPIAVDPAVVRRAVAALESSSATVTR